MAEARDRIVRPVDYAVLFANRRSHGVLLDQPDLLESSVRRMPEAVSVPRGGGNFSSWRPGNGRGHTSFRVSQGQENVSARRGRGRESASVLPSWYPRTPLRDITHILQAIERKRRAGMGLAGEGRDHQVGGLDSQVPLSGENNSLMVTPAPAVGFKRSFPPSATKVHKMLLDISKEISEEEEAGFITPEKKLLNSLDKVEKIVMEEIQKMKNSPLAKKEEREKRVRTLMSMR